MKLEQSFDVAAPLQRVWEALIDVERVAPCLPGASVTGRNEDGSYNGVFAVKIGPTSASYSGKLKMEEVDEEAHAATMQAAGTDKRGQGGAKATIFSKLSSGEGEGTRVEVVTDYHITGRLARFGRGGMIEDISERLLRQFANCLQTSLADGPGGADAVAAGGADAVAAEGADAVAAGGADAVAGAETVVAGGGETVVAGIAETVPPGSGETSAAEPSAEGVVGEGEPPASAVGSDPPSGVAPPPGVAQPPQASEPIAGLSLMASVLWGRVRRNPAPIVAAVIGFVVAVVLLRRPRR
jgi:carbon monoxide dehydrogenase subunit G